MSNLDNFGLYTNPYEQAGPPEYFFNSPYVMGGYTWHEKGALEIADPVWGDIRIGDEPRDAIFIRFMSNPLVRRSMGIEQLTLDPRYSTIPNTGHFPRFEHIWGSLLLARRMIEKSPELVKLTDREKLIFELRTFVSDLGHTAFSHLGDWMTQGFGGAENAHDEELPHVMEASGANDILRGFDIDPDEVIFPNVHDWVEDKSPDLCIDRVDYGAREAKRWMYGGIAYTQLFTSTNAYTVQDGKLAMTSVRAAEEFFRAYSILPTEHWQEPVHRTQLHLLEAMVKRALVSHSISTWWTNGPMHPRDALMTVDADFLGRFMTSDPFLWTTEPLLRRLARAQRDIFVKQRADQLHGYFLHDEQYDDLRFTFPVPNKPYPWGFHQNRTLENPQISIIPVESQDDIDDFNNNPAAVDVLLPPLKPRMIDPLILCEDGVLKRLTELKPRYQELIDQQKAVMNQAYVGRIYMNPTHASIIREGIEETNEAFTEAMDRYERLSKNDLRAFLEESYLLERQSPLLRFSYKF